MSESMTAEEIEAIEFWADQELSDLKDKRHCQDVTPLSEYQLDLEDYIRDFKNNAQK